MLSDERLVELRLSAHEFPDQYWRNETVLELFGHIRALEAENKGLRTENDELQERLTGWSATHRRRERAQGR